MPDVTQELISASAAWDEAIQARDVERAATILADDYALVLVQPTVSTVPRKTWLDTLHGYVVHDFVIEQQVVESDGDLGLVFQRVRMQATVFGVDRSGLFATTDIWRRLDGTWRVWRRHSTPLSAGDLVLPSDD